MGDRGKGILRGPCVAPGAAPFPAALLLLALAAGGAGSAWAQSEARIEIRAGTVMRIPIHIEDFAYQGIPSIRFAGGGDMPEAVLVADLERADIFVISRGRGPMGNPPIPLPPPQGTRAIASAT